MEDRSSPTIVSMIRATGWTSAEGWDAKILALSGWYDFYSGSPGELGEPTAKDTKLHITVTGTLAARMFRELGPRAQLKGSCPEGSVSRMRDELYCIREASGQTECEFGFDMRTGKSVGGMTSC